MAKNQYINDFIQKERDFQLNPSNKKKFRGYLKRTQADPKSVGDVEKAYKAFCSNPNGGGPGKH